MNSTRIEIPLALPAPHFDDERTVATARQVKPIGRAKVTESWRKLRTVLPLILLATFCGAMGAAVVNYYEDRHRVDAVATPVTNAAPAPRADASPIAVAASATPTPSVAEKSDEAVETRIEPVAEEQPTKSVTTAERGVPSDDRAVTSSKKTTDSDAAKLTRKRRVNSTDDDSTPANKKGAGRIADIFNGPNP
jgi:hypothetical protein